MACGPALEPTHYLQNVKRLCCPLGQEVVAFGHSVFRQSEFELLQCIAVCSVALENSD
jgi:hypothetical protein